MFVSLILQDLLRDPISIRCISIVYDSIYVMNGTWPNDQRSNIHNDETLQNDIFYSSNKHKKTSTQITNSFAISSLNEQAKRRQVDIQSDMAHVSNSLE